MQTVFVTVGIIMTSHNKHQSLHCQKMKGGHWAFPNSPFGWASQQPQRACVSEAHPKWHICQVAQGLLQCWSKHGKVQPKRTPSLGQMLTLFEWPEKAVWLYYSCSSSYPCQKSCFSGWSTLGIERLLTPKCSFLECCILGRCWIWPLCPAPLRHRKHLRLLDEV